MFLTQLESRKRGTCSSSTVASQRTPFDGLKISFLFIEYSLVFLLHNAETIRYQDRNATLTHSWNITCHFHLSSFPFGRFFYGHDRQYEKNHSLCESRYSDSPFLPPYSRAKRVQVVARAMTTILEFMYICNMSTVTPFVFCIGPWRSWLCPLGEGSCIVCFITPFPHCFHIMPTQTTFRALEILRKRRNPTRLHSSGGSQLFRI